MAALGDKRKTGGAGGRITTGDFFRTPTHAGGRGERVSQLGLARRHLCVPLVCIVDECKPLLVREGGDLAKLQRLGEQMACAEYFRAPLALVERASCGQRKVRVAHAFTSVKAARISDSWQS